MNILFVCTANRYRSYTAHTHYAELYPEHNFASAGIHKHSVRLSQDVNPLAQLVNGKLCKWADRIYCMKKVHADYIINNIDKSFKSKIILLDIDDLYTYMDDKLIAVLEMKIDI